MNVILNTSTLLWNIPGGRESSAFMIRTNIGENMKVVCRRFLDSGMTPEQTAKRMDVPLKFVDSCMR